MTITKGVPGDDKARGNLGTKEHLAVVEHRPVGCTGKIVPPDSMARKVTREQAATHVSRCIQEGQGALLRESGLLCLTI